MNPKHLLLFALLCGVVMAGDKQDFAAAPGSQVGTVSPGVAAKGPPTFYKEVPNEPKTSGMNIADVLKIVNDTQAHEDHLVVEHVRREREAAELGLAMVEITREALGFNLNFYQISRPMMRTDEEKKRLAENIAQITRRQALNDKAERYFKDILSSTPEIK